MGGFVTELGEKLAGGKNERIWLVVYNASVFSC